MIKADELLMVNQSAKTTPIKGKQYVEVNERIKAFRKICPNGSIQTEILSLEDGVVLMKATVFDDDGKILATGHAQEKETASFINKTSYIENCETSCTGRALGLLGIGIDNSVASKEEVENAILQQEDKLTDNEVRMLSDLCERKGLVVADTFPDGIEKLNHAQFDEAMKKLSKLKDKA